MNTKVCKPFFKLLGVEVPVVIVVVLPFKVRLPDFLGWFYQMPFYPITTRLTEDNTGGYNAKSLAFNIQIRASLDWLQNNIERTNKSTRLVPRTTTVFRISYLVYIHPGKLGDMIQVAKCVVEKNCRALRKIVFVQVC